MRKQICSIVSQCLEGKKGKQKIQRNYLEKRKAFKAAYYSFPWKKIKILKSVTLKQKDVSSKVLRSLQYFVNG